MKKTKVIDQLNSLVWPGASLSYWVERYKTQVVIILPVVRDYLLSFRTVYTVHVCLNRYMYWVLGIF